MSTKLELTAWGSDISQVKIPLPNALKWVNSYLVEGSNGYTVIDPGQHTEDAVEAWQAAFAELNMKISDVEKVVLTHHHPDHYGLAGWFQEACDAPVYMSEIAHQHAQMMWGQGQRATDVIYRLFEQHGMDSDMLAEIRTHLESFVPFVSPQPEVRYIEGDTIQLGDRTWETILTNGHASGHLCFYAGATKEMIIGDQVLPQISPNISYVPGSDPQPLESFLTSLRHLSSYDVAIAYPGHRNPFQHVQGRIADLLVHHEERLLKFRELLTEPKTAYQCCVALFNSNKLTVHQLRFAMSETLAHLIELERRGHAREERLVDGTMIYRSV
ncbi:MBL fold metallo-hydrolase [Paenibacillus selenitireducens]|uniref:MBL fold metallo-hydrolase n=1 Tax=Paenibacillus selenitireducens TaxID=1324314 RepID=A0A1T2XKD6_9BACL|nr:MBL fold metallo-hydrolase [Paenibacillus selenitireducens]OPA80288.1 MBL fold metallo-hydrolase [Paenibacillus selenitireducens]